MSDLRVLRGVVYLSLLCVASPVLAVGGTGLRGEYFDNVDFTNLVLTRTDATVDFDWSYGTPHASIGVDTFSIRWTGQVQAEYSETYTFYTVSDDGVRLWVNGQQLVNNWTDHGPTEDSGTIALTAGAKYDITMEYYESTGGTTARLLWSSASTAKAVVPQAQLFVPDSTAPAVVSNLGTSSPTSSSITLSWTAPGDDGSTGTADSYDIRYSTSTINEGNWASATPVTGEPTPALAGTSQNMTVSGLSASTTYYFAIKTSDEVPNTSAISNCPSGTTTSGSGTGLLGEYYDNADFTNLVLTRTDATVDFDWSYGTPHASIGVDTFSIRWTGQVQAQYSETYTFYTQSDDGVRLWVNGQQLVNNWTDHSPTEDSGTIALTAGQLYNITMEYYESTGGTTARLLWSSASTAKAVIPQTRLFPAGGSADTTAPAVVNNLTTSSPTSNSITLSWTAPGDDGNTGTADSYDIRYSTSTINEGNWASATPVAGEPDPAAAGTNQNMTVSGLSASTTYYFAMKTSDEVPNTCAVSNCPSGTTTSGGTANDATFVSQSVPSSMNTGQNYTVSVTMHNSGTTTWTAADRYKLGSQNSEDNMTWGVNRALLAGGDSIAPGQDKTFSWTVTAPALPGTYNFQWKMLREDVTWFGPLTPNVAVTVTDPSDPIAPAAVTNLAVGSPTSTTLTLTWTAPGDDGSTGTADSYDIRFRMGEPVTDANWDIATQVFGEPDPAAGGTSQNMVVPNLWPTITYYFAIKTSDEVVNISALSNSPSGTTTATPVNYATFVSQSVPSSMIAGQNYAVSVTMHNSGTTTWTAAAEYKLGSQNPENNTTWGMHRVLLAGGESIAPGQNKTFSWTVTAPTTPGNHIFQWKMVQDGIQWFGLRSTSLAIAVSPSGDTTAPAAVGNLATSSPTSNSLTLSWNAPGDDGSTGTAAGYDIRYSTSAINEANWASATHVIGEPTPTAAGTNQNMVVSGLADGTTYYFAIKTRDEAPNSNTSAISNITNGTTTSGSGSGTGLRGEYFDNDNFAPLALTRTDATVDFDWGGGSPDPSMWVDTFSVIWRGQVQAQYTETYTFYTVSDDGVRLWVNGQPLINNWTPHGSTEDSGTIALTAGVKYDIRMEYYEIASGAVARLLWSSASTPKAVIPQTRLFPATTCSDTAAPAAVSNLHTTNLGSDNITLLWIAPGDDGSTGTAYSYDIRYSTSTINEGNWASATQVMGEPTPAATGMEQSMVVAGLSASTTYYFAIKACDEIPNVGALSIASGTTTSGGTLWNVSTESQLQFAMANYDSGDTVSIADGTYTPVGFRIACTRGAVTVKGASGNRDNVILQGQGMLADSGLANEMVEVVSDNVTIQDLTIRGVSTFGIHLRGENDCDNPTFRNLKLIDCGERFIKGSAFLADINAVVDNLLIENCYFEQITELSGRLDNDYIAGMDIMTLNNPIIRDCTFKNIRGATGGGRGAIFLWLGINNPTIERNLIIGCDRGICVGNPAAPAGVYMPNYHSTGGIVRNNVVVRGADIAMELCYTNNLKVYYNTIYSADASYYRTMHIYDTEARTTNLQLSYNILRGEIYRNYTGQVIETGNLTGTTPAPNWFVDPTNGNLHLTASATPAFNAGVLLPEVPQDFDRVNRSSTPDIGAYEY